MIMLSGFTVYICISATLNVGVCLGHMTNNMNMITNDYEWWWWWGWGKTQTQFCSKETEPAGPETILVTRLTPQDIMINQWRMPYFYSGASHQGWSSEGVLGLSDINSIFCGFHKWGDPPFMDGLCHGKVHENPKQKWMRTGGTHILGNLHILKYYHAICEKLINILNWREDIGGRWHIETLWTCQIAGSQEWQKLSMTFWEQPWKYLAGWWFGIWILWLSIQ